MSLNITNGPQIASLSPQKNNLIAAAFAGSKDGVETYGDIGFTFMAVPTDTELLRSGAESFMKG